MLPRRDSFSLWCNTAALGTTLGDPAMHGTDASRVAGVSLCLILVENWTNRFLFKFGGESRFFSPWDILLGTAMIPSQMVSGFSVSHNTLAPVTLQ